MAVGLNTTVANAILDALCSSIAWSEPAQFWVKLHTGDPGANGTNNPAGETTRKQATFAAAASGAITTSADLVWTNVSTAETYAFVSFWDAAVAGNFIASDDLTTPRLVAVGDTFTIPTGDLDLNLTPLAA